MLVEISKPKFDVDLDIRYATTNNFTGQTMYKKPSCLLHSDAADCLQVAINLAAQLGLRLKIFDAYRPLEVQKALWNDTPNPEFLSNPETGAVPHCRGVAVDLNLIDKDGVELDMGTGFDEFVPQSHHGNLDLSTKVQENRYLLMGVMTTAGWDFYRNEWWHYQLFNPREYEKLTDSQANAGMLVG